MVVSEQALRDELSQAEWGFPEDIFDFLDPYEKKHLQIEMTGKRCLAYYMKRLEAIEFVGMDRVLDAACGVGQWTVAMAKLNSFADGVDISTTRLLTARDLASSMGIDNCSFNFSYLENLPFEKETFSGAFCYGALMLCDVPKVLKEFNRVLKPGGKLYLNANTWGWYLHSLIDRGLKKRNLVEIFQSSRMVLRSLMGKDSRIMIRENYLLEKLSETGFKVLGKGVEGGVCLKNPKIDLDAMYPSSFYGYPGILEMVVQKV